ncbi:CLUMA_CG006482, isoform A [Clunio marinus]|uniref:DNA replication complex GINS protein PSF2 n=1 Tax=Clunio marinus TaxID=568069 RepID=A0A1J1HYA2_9DIPT|nr:CLUMA_CG006482, isoform A [Clunio marinus]
MDPEEIEFIGENVSTGIIPNFNFEAIHLISNTIGPFKAGLPMYVPLWLGIHMKKQQKCRLVLPTWIDRDLLEDKKEEEKRDPNFTKMPCENYMVVSKLLFTHAADDIPNIDEVKTLIKDIFDIRQAKLRSTIDLVLIGNSSMESDIKVSFNNLTLLEINTARPFLPFANDLIARLERVYQQHSSNLNDTTQSASHFSSSTY